MEDPENGGKPSFGGASAAERRDRKKSRRRKGKRGGSLRGVASSARESQTGEPGEAALPIENEPGSQGRKRKRRRHSGASHEEPLHAGQAAAAHQSHKPDTAGAANSFPNSRKNRRKHRGKRGLQGRPLAQTKAPNVTAPSPAGSGRTQQGQAAARERSANSSGARNNTVSASAGEREQNSDFYAALDLGTNNCRLLIAQPTRPGQFRVVDAFSRIVRLGEGLGVSGRLSTDAMDRAVDALRVCAAKLKSREIRRMRLIATEACRAAENGEEFLSRVVTETGLELEIIDRETEARLAVSGCSSLVGRETRSVVLFDIGGGSSEIAVIRIGESRSSRLANHITHWTSLPVGVVTLSERYGGHDVTPSVFAAMVAEVEKMLVSFECPPVHKDSSAGRSGDFHLIGTSGTVTTLAGVHLDLPRYDRRKVDGIWLSDDEVSAMQAKLLSWNFADRAANPCIGPDRADLVLAGCAILEAIRRRWPSPRMRVADRGLREGLLTDMMAADGVWRRSHRRGKPGKERDQ